MSNGFAKLGIRESLVNILQASGVTEPTPIQRQAIPVLMSGADVIAQAQTGTGKTLAFVLPMLEMIDVEKPHVQGLILTPTRELAIQISSELNKLAPVVGAKVLAAYGGQDVERQLKKLQGTIHIVVGTPGRLLDHLRRESVQFFKLNMLVLDEADQMLHMGFLTEVQDIIAQTSSRRQTLLFSATMPGQVRNLAKAYMKEPAEIQIEAKQVTLKEIDQVVIQTTDRGKQDALLGAIKEYKPYLAMIFCRTKRRASDLNEALQEAGYASDELHGDLSQAKREQVMKRFREAKIELLVATDVAARGLDVEGVTHVFNYDMPQDADSYIHRIGRTGRAGHQGVAVTFATQHDRVHLQEIENGIKMSIRRAGEEAPRRRERKEETSRWEEGSGSNGGLSRRSAGGERGKGSARRGGGRGAAGAGRGRQAGAEGSLGGRSPRSEAAAGAGRRSGAEGGQYGRGANVRAAAARLGGGGYGGGDFGREAGAASGGRGGAGASGERGGRRGAAAGGTGSAAGGRRGGAGDERGGRGAGFGGERGATGSGRGQATGGRRAERTARPGNETGANKDWRGKVGAVSAYDDKPKRQGAPGGVKPARGKQNDGSATNAIPRSESSYGESWSTKPSKENFGGRSGGKSNGARIASPYGSGGSAGKRTAGKSSGAARSSGFNNSKRGKK
jgi:ATP-dependent RNA helicase DeaD